MTPEAMEALTMIWNSLYTADELKPSDAILAFGCADPLVASRAAELYLQGWAPLLVFSGGLGKGTEGRLAKSEAECYADTALAMGVPAENMILETKSTNTGENLRFTYDLIKEQKIRRAIVVHQPNMGKRIRATLQKQWPDPHTEFLISPADRSLEAYLDRLLRCGVSEEEIVSNIVGDLQRMELYSQLGFQVPVEMPVQAWKAFEQMKTLGYTKYLYKEG